MDRSERLDPREMVPGVRSLKSSALRPAESARESLGFKGGRYTGTQMARRWSRVKVKWEMSVFQTSGYTPQQA